MDARRIEVTLSQDKINLINGIYQKELDHWKDATMKMALDEDKANQLKYLAPPRFFLAHKATKNAKKTGIDEIMFYLKSQCSGDENQVVFIQSYRCGHSSEEIFKELKAMSKYVKESQNMSLKNNTLFGEWSLNACRCYKYIKKKDSPQRFDKWVYKECEIGKQTLYNNINLYKLMRVAPKLCVC